MQPVKEAEAKLSEGNQIRKKENQTEEEVDSLDMHASMQLPGLKSDPEAEDDNENAGSAFQVTSVGKDRLRNQVHRKLSFSLA